MKDKTIKRTVRFQTVNGEAQIACRIEEWPSVFISYCAGLMATCANPETDWSTVSLTELPELRKNLIVVGHAAKAIRRERCGEQVGE
jgi:hypothetical protein